jgi:glucose-1-phosphate thymidylyltransferase
MKGIVLAGGTGSRLWPVTAAVSKQLLPVYNKPMIYYPLSTLMLAGVREIAIITTPASRAAFELLLGDGSALGIELRYIEQAAPRGIAEAVSLGADFLGDERLLLVLGDNIFHGAGVGRSLPDTLGSSAAAHVFLYQVQDPSSYGVASLDALGRVTHIDEKPPAPKSRWAVTGLYSLDARAREFAAELKPSARGELEIADLLNRYAELGELSATQLTRGTAWFDGGTASGLLRASNYIETIESRQGALIGAPEEISVLNGWTSAEQQLAQAARFGSEYALALANSLQTPKG